VLRPGYTLPPLMFTEDEIEALALGTRWVADRADGPLASAANHALAKIAAVLDTTGRSLAPAQTNAVANLAQKPRHQEGVNHC
jgi:predicted DNA-binding transcriptional regulator YafY